MESSEYEQREEVFSPSRTSRPAGRTHSTSFSMGTGDSCGGKAAGAWIWSLISIERWSSEWVELYLPSPCIPSWRLQGQLHLSFCIKFVRNELGEAPILRMSTFKENILCFEGIYSLDPNLYRNEQAVGPVSKSYRGYSFFIVRVCEQSTHCSS